MLIDNEKFIGLLVENSGIEKEKVEKYLEELINDIKVAFDEDEGYEVEGFGIFSKLGANVLFIPSEELETEINYKYVGMEPIVMPDGAPKETVKEDEVDDEKENPIQGILDGGESEDADGYEDPFAELIGEVEEETEDTVSEEELVDEDYIEAAVEEEIENEEQEEEVFEEFLEEQLEADDELFAVDNIIEESEDAETEDLEASLKDIFGDDDEVAETQEDEKSEEQEEVPGPDKWGIDAHKEDDQEEVFSGLLGDEATKSSALIDEEDIFAEEEVDDEDVENEKPAEEKIDFSALGDETTEEEDFDDPFMDLEEEESKEDFIPIVTNISSEITSNAKGADESKLEESSEKEGVKKSRQLKSARDRNKRSPMFLYLVLALVILAGSGYLLAYYGIVNMQGITPIDRNRIVQQTTPPAIEPQSTPPETNSEAETATAENSQDVSEISNTTSTPNINEQVRLPKETQRDLAPIVADENTPENGGIITPINVQAGAEPYGLTGTATKVGNNGYTIVLYTLSKKSGADAQFEKLSKDGYRVIIKEKPSDTYGVLYRVSIGQFKSLAAAAVAAEKVDPDVLGNYIISKI